MLLSATADQLAMKYVGLYLNLGQYDIIGDPANYPLPQTVINLEQCADADVVRNVVSRVKELIATKQHRFKIHIVTMTKEDAQKICSDLNEEGISSMWLTSDQDLNEREKHHVGMGGKGPSDTSDHVLRTGLTTQQLKM